MGKGSARRKEDYKKILANWDLIFRPKKECCGQSCGCHDSNVKSAPKTDEVISVEQ